MKTELIVPRTVTLVKGEHKAATAIDASRRGDTTPTAINSDDRFPAAVGGNSASPRDGAEMSQPISAFGHVRAFVLLGDPGAGKTTEFKQAARLEGVYVPVRRFLREARHRPEWKQETLFIDGLDEARAGDGDPRKPLDDILEKLQTLGRPRVRISCRAAAWLSGNDDQEFRSLSGYEDLLLLRLDPLTEANANQLLAEHGGMVGDDFLLQARDRGLAELLDHPLTLRLLAKAFATDGRWPEGRLETFEMACRALAREYNQEHKVAREVAVDDKISAAGCLATFSLIAGKEHIEPTGTGHADSEADLSLMLEELPAKARPAGGINVLRAALDTRLFSSVDTPGALVPAHRNVAEHLAAKHLHGQIEEGVPASRVLALLAGADGTVAPSLRGLAAWLATLNSDARLRLVEQAPFDVLTSGDPSVFPPNQKRHLVRALAQLPRHRGFMLRHASPAVCAALAGRETMEFLRSCIAENDPETQPQSVVEFLFEILASEPSTHGAPSVREVVAVARDDRWMFAARKQALAAAMKIAEQDDEGIGLLRSMLEDLSTGRVKDLNQELRGRLVEGLYPRHLEPSEIPPLLPRAIQPILRWHLSRTLAEKTEASSVSDVLDALCAFDRDQADADYPELFGGILEEAFVKLLDRGLRQHGETIDTRRLYDWLSVHPKPIHIQAAASPVEPWLARHPDIRLALLREHIRREGRLWDDTQSEDIRLGDHDRQFRMSGLLLLGLSPHQAATMCFGEAGAVVATEPADARRYVDLAVAKRSVHLRPPKGSTFTDALSKDWRAWASAQLQDAPELIEYLDQLAEREEERRQAHATRQAPYLERVNEAVRQRRSLLLSGDASPTLLYELALAYLGMNPMERSLEPVERLREWLSEDSNDGDDDASTAVEAALRALGQIPSKVDIPSLPQLLELEREGKVYTVTYSVLAGLDHLGRRQGAIPGSLSDDRIRSALGMHYMTVVMDKHLPHWVGVLLDAKPKLVAEVLVKVMKAQIRGRCDYEEHHLRSLNADMLNEVVPKLLNAFPVRGTKRHLAKLQHILEFALHNLPRDELRALVERKLRFGSMDTAQRAVWLGIALRTWPRRFVGRALHFLADKRDVTVSQLASAWASGNGQAQFSPSDAGPGGVFLLLQWFGRRYAPGWMSRRSLAESEAGRAFIVSEEEEVHKRVSKLVGRCIRYLSSEPSVAGRSGEGERARARGRSASRALRLLAEDPTLASWRDELDQACEEQTELRRETTRRLPSLREIVNVLSGGPPANASDLAEVVVEQLRRLTEDIRGGNADGWRLFWNEDGHGRPVEPKPENSCRDALLLALRPRLESLNIDVQPEPHYAADKRADIRASVSGGPALPIEVKKSNHRELWSAVGNQLIKQYVCDPACEGHGIYLVLWFGVDCMVPPSGRRPKSPEQLEESLRRQLSEEQQRFIRVVVLDVSPP